MTTHDAATLLAAYDCQGRAQPPAAKPGITLEWDGPLLRTTGGHQGHVTYRDLAGLRGADLDALIARQVAHFTAAGQPFEWKTRAHDEPADLPARLLMAGFVPEEMESVLIGVAAEQRAQPILPDGVTLRLTRDPADFDRIATLEAEVWNEDKSHLAPRFAQTMTTEPDTLDIVVIEAGGRVVSAAWSIYTPGTPFTYFAGGSTLAAWRKHGLYRALVAFRADLAAERGYAYLQVDASADSRPILERLGFTFVTTTTPYILESA
jgi:GNAT superfamily N-acetyltransferase